MSKSGHNIEELKTLPYQNMTKGQRISAAKHGIIPPVRSERERQLRQRYNLLLEDYQDLFVLGGRRCWACRKEWHKDLYVDHCHKGGHVRGLLCAKCNTSAGFVENNIEHIRCILEYLNMEI